LTAAGLPRGKLLRPAGIADYSGEWLGRPGKWQLEVQDEMGRLLEQVGAHMAGGKQTRGKIREASR